MKNNVCYIIDYVVYFIDDCGKPAYYIEDLCATVYVSYDITRAKVYHSSSQASQAMNRLKEHYDIDFAFTDKSLVTSACLDFIKKNRS